MCAVLDETIYKVCTKCENTQIRLIDTHVQRCNITLVYITLVGEGCPVSPFRGDDGAKLSTVPEKG